MKRLPVVAALVAVAAGCGGSGNIEDQVQSQYGDYAAKHGFDAKARNVANVTCTHEATKDFDGWCRVRAKGFTLTYDVPYRGDRVLWGESGPGAAPAS